jgi:hypothetical protein
MRNAGELRREVQLTNPIFESPPRGYGDPNPVVVGLESSLTTLHRYDFPSHQEAEDDSAAWEEAVRNNLAWMEAAKYDVLRIGVGDAATSLATEATEWDWLIQPTRTESRVQLFCTTPAFAEVDTIKNTLRTLPWKGLVAGEYAQSDLDELIDATTKDGIALYSGHTSYYGPKNEFMVGFATDQSAQQGGQWIDARAVSSVAPGAVRNLLFLLTLQFQPDGVFTHLSTNEHAYAWIMNTNSQDVRNWYTYFRGRAGKRPIANIMFDASHLEIHTQLFYYQRQFIATISSSLGLAGYDIAITKGTPEPNADLHVILTEINTLSDTAQSLAAGEGPILWLPILGIGIRDEIPAYTSLFGLNPEDIDLDEGSSGPADFIEVDGQRVRWGTENGQIRFPTVVKLPGDETIVRSGNKAIFNGVALHPEAAFVIAQTIGEMTDRVTALQAPFNGYGVVGTRSAFFATGSTELRVNLHHDDGSPFEDGTRIRIVRFNGYGNPRGREVIDYEAPFTEVLTEHELIIVEAMPS